MEANVTFREYRNGNAIVSVEGRVTSDNAEDFGDKLLQFFSENPDKTMVIDAKNLEMISSAGLRRFLVLKKRGCKFFIVNVSPEVYEVFDITGFVEILDVRKAFRSYEIDNLKIVGEGAKGIVYAIDKETVIKVYKDPTEIEDIVRERECARKALLLGVPTAIPFDIVHVKDSLGSIFEMVNAESLTQTILYKPAKFDALIHEYASIMHETHDIADDGKMGFPLPKIKDMVFDWIEFLKAHLDAETIDTLVAFVNSIEDTNTLLHGDGHPSNVMCTDDGMLFIDMDTLCVGNPIFDISIVYTALIGYKTLDRDDHFLKLDFEACEKVWDAFVHSYYAGEEESVIKEIERKCKVLCYTRLYRRSVRREDISKEVEEKAKKLLLEALQK